MKFAIKTIALTLTVFTVSTLISTTSVTVTAAEQYSPIVTQDFNGHTYSVYETGLSWYDAESYCESLGGHLVTIISADEQNFVQTLIKDGKKMQYWIGATDEETWGIWKWVTGEKWEYTNWGSGEPSNSKYYNKDGEHFLAMRLTGNWNDSTPVYNDQDAYRVSNTGFICEWDNQPSDASEWARSEIERADDLGLIPDSLDSKYQQNITREEFCVLAVSFYEGITGAPLQSAPIVFSDTSNMAVMQMAQEGIVSGYEDGTFRPANGITRQEAAVLLGKLTEKLTSIYSIKSLESTFDDARLIPAFPITRSENADSFALSYIGLMQYLKIMNGVGFTNRFYPHDKLTREQSILSMMRIWDISEDLKSSSDTVPGGETKVVLRERLLGSTLQIYLNDELTEMLCNTDFLDAASEAKASEALENALVFVSTDAGIAIATYMPCVISGLAFDQLFLKLHNKGNGIIIEINAQIIPPMWISIKSQ